MTADTGSPPPYGRLSGKSADCFGSARPSLKPLFRTGPAMRTARPATGTAFTCFKFLDRALDSAAARCSLFSRDDPTNPFVPRQRRQILPGRSRCRIRTEDFAEVRRGLVQGCRLALVIHRRTPGDCRLPRFMPGPRVCFSNLCCTLTGTVGCSLEPTHLASHSLLRQYSQRVPRRAFRIHGEPDA